MSSELRRQLRVALGPDITGLQRAVALEIADDARYDDNWRYDPDKGRRSKVRLAELVEWTGAKDANVVRNAIKRLSAAGWEFRIPIGQDKHGKPMYAVPGKAMTFRVPDFEGVARATPMPEGGAGATPRESQGSPYGEQGLPIGVAVATPPSPSSLGSLTSSPSSSGPLPSAGDEPAGQGGGGGDSPFEDQAAEALAASLDYRGKAPKPSQAATIRRLAAAALRAGWTEQELKEYLDLKGDPNARNAAALYGHRLKPEELPDLQAFRKAARRPLEGTDAIVSGWMDLARPGASHRPYQDPWGRIEAEAAAGVRPEGWEKWKHCGVCDEVTRCRPKPDNAGELRPSPCAACHPVMQF
ncbi:hypothetical protein ACFYRI_14750 [Streptomyces microflavus]|uniref:hypothetical protein n=1 Tax=Streptomyces microflavus TaxID=1919 RepID=UPI0036AC7EE5